LVQIYGTYPPGFYPESVAFINEKNALHRLVQTSYEIIKNGTLDALPFYYLILHQIIPFTAKNVKVCILDKFLRHFFKKDN
jgi:hypothetical protein